MFVYFWHKERERERQSMSRGGAERGGDTESEAGSRLWAVSTEPNVGLKLTDREIMTWAEVRHSTDWATQAPRLFGRFLMKISISLIEIELLIVLFYWICCGKQYIYIYFFFFAGICPFYLSCQLISIEF